MQVNFAWLHLFHRVRWDDLCLLQQQCWSYFVTKEHANSSQFDTVNCGQVGGSAEQVVNSGKLFPAFFANNKQTFSLHKNAGRDVCLSNSCYCPSNHFNLLKISSRQSVSHNITIPITMICTLMMHSVNVTQSCTRFCWNKPKTPTWIWQQLPHLTKYKQLLCQTAWGLEKKNFAMNVKISSNSPAFLKLHGTKKFTFPHPATRRQLYN